MDLAPIVVVIPHRHGKVEATRRIKAGIEEARTHYAAKFKVAEETWDGDRLSFRIALLGQPCTGTIEIGDDDARAEVKLSWYLGHMAKPAERFIQQEGARILSGP
ncbi:MAG: polyhydroxyalkanoic acid synthase [Rhizobiales bacterium]|nr:polyhydroxyalkanoic acid synthase [Hyphomicrobiales bacterium]